MLTAGAPPCALCDGVIPGEGDGDEDGGGECRTGAAVCNPCPTPLAIPALWGLPMPPPPERFAASADSCIPTMKRSSKSCNAPSPNALPVSFEAVHEKFRRIVGRHRHNTAECLQLDHIRFTIMPNKNPDSFDHGVVGPSRGFDSLNLNFGNSEGE